MKRAPVAVIVGSDRAAARRRSWYYRTSDLAPQPRGRLQPADDEAWIDHLYHANPADVEAATRQVQQLGPRALPLIHQTLQDPSRIDRSASRRL